MTVQFTKAEKKQSKLRLALMGPSGSGKTYSALVIASGLGSKIALIDTENHRAALKAGEPGVPDFDTIAIDPAYTIDKYFEAMDAARGKYDVLIIDSISHAWAGEGGLLDRKGALDARGGNNFTNWAPITREHERFKAALLHFPSHIIATMRSRQDYVIEANDRGKTAPKKVGLAPIQRDGMEYEFSFVFDLDMEHNAKVSKTDASQFDKKIFVPSKQTGEELLNWLNEGVPEIEIRLRKAKIACAGIGITQTQIEKEIAGKSPDEALDHLVTLWTFKSQQLKKGEEQ